ncbi:MAG TPA: transglycosylase family protein [Pseudonocardia sp.]|nr:transglycosylase family protein [Pseudonocardia sp.]
MSRHEAGPAPLVDRPARSGGRHRKPSSPGPATAIITTGTFAIVPFVLSAGTAQAAELAPSAGLDAIAKCESGGNPQAQNSGSTASGLYQFLDSSWRAYGGSKYGPRAKDATPAQQTEIAHAAVARSGLTPWKASQHCWGGKVSTASINASKPAAAPKPVIRPVTAKPGNGAGAVRPAVETVSAAVPQHGAPAAGRHAALPQPRTAPEANAASGTYKVRPGDSLSRIAKSHGTSWQSLWEANKGSVHSPHSLHPGEELKLPRAADLAHTGHGSASFVR